MIRRERRFDFRIGRQAGTIRKRSELQSPKRAEGA
jgi:hypothetical protein